MNTYTRQDLSVMQAWPLERKIRVTQAKIIEWYHHYGGKVAVSFSGGKDSTVLLDLARRAFPDIPAVFVDTGLEYPEIREFVKTVPNVTWLRPEMPFSKVICCHGQRCSGVSPNSFNPITSTPSRNRTTLTILTPSPSGKRLLNAVL